MPKHTINAHDNLTQSLPQYFAPEHFSNAFIANRTAYSLFYNHNCIALTGDKQSGFQYFAPYASIMLARESLNTCDPANGPYTLLSIDNVLHKRDQTKYIVAVETFHNK